MKTKTARRILVLPAICMVVLGTASAATQYWDGNVSSANSTSDNSSAAPLNWLSGGNWDNGTTSAPRASWTSGDAAIFGGTFSGTQTVTLSSQAIVGDGTVIGGVGSSYKISLTGTGFNQLGAPSGTITLNADSTLSADAASNNAHNLMAITLNGGTLTSANGPAGPANDGGFGNWIVRGVTVGGSSLSTISSSTLVINSGSFNVADSVAGSGTDLLVSSKIISGTLTKDGAGTLTLTGTNNYAGATSVNAGTLEIATAGAINTSSGVTVAAGAKLAYNSSTSLSVATTLNGNTTANRAVLGGTGTIGASVILDNLGDTLSPGNSPGIQNYTPAQTWSSFSYDWEVNNFTGTTAGTDFDQISLGSTLNLNGGSGSYILNVLGLTAGNVSGNVPNFSEITRSWTILTSAGTLSGFNAANWTINTAGFTDPDTGIWAIGQSGNNLVLSYTVVPEPSSALLGGLGLLALLRRHRKQLGASGLAGSTLSLRAR